MGRLKSTKSGAPGAHGELGDLGARAAPATTAAGARSASRKKEPSIRPIDFSPVTESVARRWGPNQFLYRQVMRRYVAPSQQLLQVGCGEGIHAIRFAHLGYQTFAVDEREDRLATARRYARRYGLASRCEFECAPATKLPYADNRFDVVFGFGVLGQNAESASAELARVTKKGGVTVLVESIRSSSRAADQLTESEWSLGAMDLDPEEKNNARPGETGQTDPAPRAAARGIQERDIERLDAWYCTVECERFTLGSRLNHLRLKLPEVVVDKLSRLDVRLRDACPPLADLSQVAVLVCMK